MEAAKSQKEPQSVEKSLGYLSWSIKELVVEIKAIKEIMAGYTANMNKFVKDNDECPF